MDVDVSKNTYVVKAMLKTGPTLDLTGAIVQLSWQDPTGEVAQRASITLAQATTPLGLLSTVLPLLTVIVIYGNNTEVFRGVVWEWTYSSDNSTRDIELTCYDNFIYAQNSDFYAYYPAGKSTKDIISDICTKNGIALKYEYESITHAKMKCDPQAVADHIFNVLKETKETLKTEPVAIFDKGTLIIRPKGKNTDIFFFETKKSAISTMERMSLNGLVTKVSILGKEDKDGRRNVESTKLGKLEYGTLQRYVYHDGTDTLAKAEQEAQKIIDAKGKPERLMMLTAPDVPMIRKGDRVRVSAGSLIGFFYVKGITHNAISRTMVLELEYV